MYKFQGQKHKILLSSKLQILHAPLLSSEVLLRSFKQEIFYVLSFRMIYLATAVS